MQRKVIGCGLLLLLPNTISNKAYGEGGKVGIRGRDVRAWSDAWPSVGNGRCKYEAGREGVQDCVSIVEIDGCCVSRRIC